MPQLSVVIPTYNHAGYIDGTVEAVLDQGVADVEVVVTDDCSGDGTCERVRAIAERDPRVRLIVGERNLGTLGNRKRGVLASTGDTIMLLDADDRLAPGSLPRLLQAHRDDPVDIMHFGATVVASTPEAQDAAAGMERFLTPVPRRLEGEEILSEQFAHETGFDWSVHHKLFDGDLLRRAYGAAADDFFCLADDIYLCFIADSYARTYRALPDAPWYVYHLGRGYTLGSEQGLEHEERLVRADVKALRLAKDFVAAHGAELERDDWGERLDALSARLAFHSANEWRDNVPDPQKAEALPVLAGAWVDEGAGGSFGTELWRFVRDDAYALLCAQREGADITAAERRARESLDHARTVEAMLDDGQRALPRYLDMRAAGTGHCVETGLVRPDTPSEADPGTTPPAEAPRGGILRRLRGLIRP